MDLSGSGRWAVPWPRTVSHLIKLGLDPRQVTQVVNTGTGQSYASEFFTPRSIIIECTGNPIAAVQHCIATFSSKKDIINVTVEADAACG